MNVLPKIKQILQETEDPYLNLPVESYNLEPQTKLDGNQLSVDLLAGFPAQFLYESLLPILFNKIQNTFPEYNLELSINHLIRPHRSQMVGKVLKGVKNTIAVASGKGGVGKSTVAVNLAVALAKNGAKVGILDADIYGPSVPLMLGKSNPVQIDNEFYLPVMAHGVQAMSIGYLTADDPALIWRGPMLAKALLQMLDITKWDNLDYLFIDLPPGTGDIQLSLVQKIPLTAAIVVTTPQLIATQDAEKAIKMFQKTNIDVLGIVENMSLHTCSHCGHQETIFAQGGAENISQHYKIPLLGQLPLNQEISKHSDLGIPIATESGPLSEAFIKTALKVGIELSKKPLNYADKFPNIVIE